MKSKAINLLLVIIAASAWGCALTTERYSISADNVESIRSLGGQKVRVGEFSSSPGVGVEKIQCAALTISPPDGVSFANYVRSAIVSELKIAGAYSETSPVSITGDVDALELDASGFSLTGHWTISLKVNRGNKSITVSEKYSFRSQTLDSSACEGSARQFSNAVQNLVHKLVSNPEFAAMRK